MVTYDIIQVNEASNLGHSDIIQGNEASNVSHSDKIRVDKAWNMVSDIIQLLYQHLFSSSLISCLQLIYLECPNYKVLDFMFQTVVVSLHSLGTK